MEMIAPILLLNPFRVLLDLPAGAGLAGLPDGRRVISIISTSQHMFFKHSIWQVIYRNPEGIQQQYMRSTTKTHNPEGVEH